MKYLALTTFTQLAILASTARICLADLPPPLIERFDPSTRGKVVLALAGLVLLGVLMMGLTWLAFRMLRQQFARTDEIIERQKHAPADDQWASKPLASGSDEVD